MNHVATSSVGIGCQFTRRLGHAALINSKKTQSRAILPGGEVQVDYKHLSPSNGFRAIRHPILSHLHSYFRPTLCEMRGGIQALHDLIIDVIAFVNEPSHY
jgi:hypothetical protein